ncbi:ejaculatory bulb-specific protein 3-like [Colias croceus]|uniref:ejaculatory bulb-specific protein 3-like n=1 Tax=Colias crocea TaxID=72248 RepID=UPI001E27BB9E|nr:ejaculatory bulb-specific protein 3-like [Colias croceus]XP_045501652.1 ejaculatory bulb-specific protein 3-like [Colias croceus]
MTKHIITLFFLLYAQCYCENSTYTTKYDNVNLDEVLSSERLLNGYVNCLLDQGPCTPDGKELRRNLPDAIQNDCKKCTERQKNGADKVMQFIIDNRPEDWKKLEEKFNPDGSYRLQYITRKNQVNSTVSD